MPGWRQGRAGAELALVPVRDRALMLVPAGRDTGAGPHTTAEPSPMPNYRRYRREAAH
ncbi:hypothetical protein [Streptomyces sp. NRRL S-1896]|uniref:hypothetical protein n=1 Tax=Streptomyces sp. NRRL S-1896 TaxID=1463893 RepID=UPI000B1CAF93|nr:hypothetical protein [Streptomyces sp. NRRL S-1896]